MSNIEINDVVNEILSSKDSLKKLEELLSKMKRMSSNHYINDKMDKEYMQLQFIVCLLDKKMPIDYICDTTMTIKNIKNISKNSINFFTDEEILNYIVNYTRTNFFNCSSIYEFKKIDTTNKCYDCSEYIKQICSELGIACERIIIIPGYSMYTEIFDCIGFHHFNIVKLRDKIYLMDCTYKQFFKSNKSSLERLGVPYITLPNVGTFMILDNKRKLVSDTILKQGWIEATDDNIKHYFDGFTISFRNGLYYEKLGRVSYDTNFNASDYKRFLSTNDSLLNYEDEDTLGYQMKPLKDYRLNFKIK